ncbi:MAG TPA: hypothetical protein VHE35_34315, partial [Kofleriaceae bacterium]|nr:hypothetical protein [Kofleriaceae bacterium]
MSYDLEQRIRAAGGAAAPDAPAPGKRALTDRLPPRAPSAAPSLRGQERELASLDAIGDYAETRATIEGAPAADPLGFLDQEAHVHHPHRH